MAELNGLQDRMSELRVKSFGMSNLTDTLPVSGAVVTGGFV